MNQMSRDVFGDGREIGDITIFLQLYNKYKFEFVASTND